MRFSLRGFAAAFNRTMALRQKLSGDPEAKYILLPRSNDDAAYFSPCSCQVCSSALYPEGCVSSVKKDAAAASSMTPAYKSMHLLYAEGVSSPDR